MTEEEKDAAMHEAFGEDPAVNLRAFRLIVGLVHATQKRQMTTSGTRLLEILVAMHDGLKNGRVG